MDYKDISKKNLNNHIDRLIDILDEIETGKITILTGGNATGKSVIRKLLNCHLMKKLGCDNGVVSSISMQMRVNTPGSLLGTGLDSMMKDLPWESTSEHTVCLLEGLLDVFNESEGNGGKRFLVIDELETGMSKEVQAGTCIWLNEILNPETVRDKTYGVLLITHSDTVVRTIRHDSFINIDGMTEEEWLNREIVPVTPDELKNWSSALYAAIGKREKKK
jgi:energy-coupling factor transporter ATP-binding protein EcfA2